jgi:hypothetical protein
MILKVFNAIVFTLALSLSGSLLAETSRLRLFEIENMVSPLQLEEVKNSPVKKRKYPIHWPKNRESVILSSEIEIPVNYDVLLTAKLKRVKREGNFLFWMGEVEEDPNGWVTLVYSEGKITGDIKAGGRSYYIQNVKEGESFLVEVEPKESHVDDATPVTGGDDDLSKQATYITTKSSDKFIDVMVLYTDDLDIYSEAEAIVRGRVESVNEMLAQSCVGYRYRLVHIDRIVYGETGNSSTDLSNIASDGTIATLRDLHGADLVMLVTKTLDICGRAYMTDHDSFIRAEYGFGVVGYSCGAQTMAHEWGHNVGLYHDRYESGVDFTEESNLKSGYGFVDLAHRHRSIMSYNTHCSDLGFYCDRVDLFSSPHIKVSGVPFGYETHVDAVKQLNRRFGYIANFRASKSSYDPDIDLSCSSSSGKTVSDKDLHCFIATAAYGSYLSPQVKRLRKFRDQFLLKNRWGQKFVKLYYKYSPAIALKISKSDFLKSIVRAIIYSILFIYDFALWILLTLLFLILFRFQKKYLLSLLFITLFPIPGKSSVAHKSLVTGVHNQNPALYLKKTEDYRLFLNYQKQDYLLERDYINKEQSIGVSSLGSGYFSENYFLQFQYFLNSEKTELFQQELYSDVKTKWKEGGLDLDFGWNYLIPIGIRFSQRTLEKETINWNQNLLNLGSFGEFSKLKYGYGIELVEEKGDDVATSRWLQLYLGAAVGEASTDSKWFFEWNLKRSPQVANIEEEKITAHGEALTNSLSFEYASSYGTGSQYFYRLEYIMKSEENFNTEISSNTLSTHIGADLFSPGLQLTLGYQLESFQSLSEETQKETRISLNLEFKGSGTGI